MTDQQYDAPDAQDDTQAQQGLSLSQFEKWHDEIKQQPRWRADADRQSDYVDGNQLDSDILRKQAAIGMPPAIEPLIGPAMDSVYGMEAQHRTDWRVIPDSDVDGDEVADALNNKLNTAERQSKADKACSDAFKGQADVGIGWVEVSRDPNPFNFPYRAKSIHRNEIWWDWLSKDRQGTDSMRYLVRRKWTDKDQAKLLFPDQAELIEQAARGSNFDRDFTNDGGRSTGLAMRGDYQGGGYGAVTSPVAGDPPGTSYPMLSAVYSAERGSSIEEQEWRDTENSRVCLSECWYRVWVRALVMKMPDGRIVEYDAANDMHMMMVALGVIKPFSAVITKVRIAWWLGPHRLSDDPTPYKHNKFPYVPFWGKREDRTGVPFGLVRGMMYLQDNVNATNAKLRWGMSAVQTTRTDGAVLDDDDTFRSEVARVDSDIVLDAQHMGKEGAVFKIERNFELNTQQFQMLTDSREGIKRCSGITDAFEGKGGKNQSGVAVANLTEQATQSLADLYDNFRVARSEVGELLLSLIVEDTVEQETVTIKGGAISEDRTIQLNVPQTDPDTGMQYLNNDVSRTLLKVTLEDVPHTPSFRSQQLNAFTEVYKSAPEKYQDVLFPQLLSLMDVPNKAETIKAVKDANQQPTPDEIQQQISQAVEQARTKDMIELKTQEVAIKGQLSKAQIAKITADAVKSGVEAAYAAMQAGEVIAAVPQVAPIADQVMSSAGYQDPNPAGVSPDYLATSAPTDNIGINPVKNRKTGMQFTPGIPNNTNPVLPAVPTSPQEGQMHGIETQRADGA
jgi:hypothetical protein